MKEEDSLPAEPAMENDPAFADTGEYPLPEGVDDRYVVRAVSGTVGANGLQDFHITWKWEYYKNDEQDQTDTAFGNKAAWEIPDEVFTGLYIVVAESGEMEASEHETAYTCPGVPDTGDPDSNVLYLILMGMALLLWMIWKGRKEKRCGKL